MKCGGFNDSEICQEHLDIINSKRDEIENILIKEEMRHFEVLELQQQVVAGMNYIFKIKLQKEGDECVNVRIYKSLCDEISIHSIE